VLFKFLMEKLGDFVRKELLAFGAILVFVGVLVSSASTSSIEKLDYPIVAEAEGQWEVSADFNESEKLLVDFLPPKFGEYIFPNGDKAVVDVEIFDPDNNKTEFRITFYPRRYPDFELLSNDGGLTVNEPIEGVGGVTRLNGLYTARIDEFASIYYDGGPPGHLSLHKEVVEREYPYRSVLPIGVALIVAGASLSVWAKSSKRTQRLRKKRG